MSAPGGTPAWWSQQGPHLSVVPEPRSEDQPVAGRGDDWLDALWSDPSYYTPLESIADRVASDDDAVDWERVRAAVRRARPVRSLLVLGAGVLPALWWAHGVAAPLADRVSVDAAWAAGVLGAGIGAVGVVSGGRLRRWMSAALLMAAVGGTLLAGPTRTLIATWIVGA
ncbi:hypothetical protein [Streptomyces cinereoruber]|uniref:hypothetical protein n=1 Tax=Streptomyces cinereoruber TaxID=67260 RepID=UPI003658D15A